MKLSESQQAALESLGEGPMSDFTAAWLLGGPRNRILNALESRGLARFFGTSQLWKITPDGRHELRKLGK